MFVDGLNRALSALRFSKFLVFRHVCLVLTFSFLELSGQMRYIFIIGSLYFCFFISFMNLKIESTTA